MKNPFLVSQVTPGDQLTAKTAVRDKGAPAGPLVSPASPDLPGLQVWPGTASRHSASCPWWRRRSRRRTAVWRAPGTCEEAASSWLKTEQETLLKHSLYCNVGAVHGSDGPSHAEAPNVCVNVSISSSYFRLLTLMSASSVWRGVVWLIYYTKEEINTFW